jgi:hypothetical protein
MDIVSGSESLRVTLPLTFTPEPVYDKDIVPTVTGRRIKNDD